MEDLEIFRGDTFEFNFSATNAETGENYTFAVGDILKCGIKSNVSKISNYIVFKEILITEATDTVHFEFSHEEMKDIETGDKIIEIELTTNGKVYTIYQKSISIKGDVVYE